MIQRTKPLRKTVTVLYNTKQLPLGLLIVRARDRGQTKPASSATVNAWEKSYEVRTGTQRLGCGTSKGTMNWKKAWRRRYHISLGGALGV